MLKALSRDDFSFLAGMTHPSCEIERMAFTNALDSIIWSQKDDSAALSELKFPRFFELSGLALRLTSKFGGLKYEEKTQMLT